MKICINRFELDLYLTSGFIRVPNLFEAYWDLRNRHMNCYEMLTPKAVEARCKERGEVYYRTEEERLKASWERDKQEAALYREAANKRLLDSKASEPQAAV